jgi:putative colanic acid biosynthesis acetyltransferase WcaF
MADILKGIDPSRQASFSLQNRIARALWGVVCFLLFRFSPRPLYFWRIFLLRCFGAKIGRGCHVYPKVTIWAPWNLEMDDEACLADDVVCCSMEKIKVGRKAVISQGVRLYTGTHDYTDPGFQLYARPVVVGSQAWIAAEAFIMPGVTVGEGAVIGARSVVAKDMPAWTVCAGNPCRPIKPRQMKT